ncbi:TIR domain-containing protein, partial [Frankia canadensis]|uniref:TIR domain-containing protein n=1 Tax=Frankia canadensis TaxID=1836972 RepID=UPI001402F356
MGEHAGGAAEHLFISVAGPDRPWARWVAAKLEAEGFRVEYDEWDWAAGSSFVGRMDEALATANRMIAILSPHYFDPASYGRAEREAALIRAHEREGFLVPVRVSPCELTPLVSRLSFIDLVGCDEREAATRLITGLRGPRHPDHSERIVWPGDAPSPAPFPGPGPVGAEGNDRRRPGGGSVRDAVTVLHLPELRAGLDGAPLPLAELPNRVAEDVAALDPAWSPDLVVVTGDVAEHGLRREYETAVQTFDDLLGAFGLSRSRLVMVPGSRDVNLAACRSYFDTCEADEIDPEPPYWPKWRHFAVMIENFYAGAGAAGAAGGVFAVGQEWSLFPIDELNLVVAAMNSTMDVTHHAPNDRRTIGAAQEQWFASRLAAYAQRGWLRLGAVQEMESAASLAASLRHRSDLLGMLNLVLSGQDDTHRGVKVGRALRVGVPSGRHDPAKPEAESAPRYQLARVERDGLTRRLRHWSAESAQWADLGTEPLRRTARHWAGIDATLPDPAAQPDNPSDRHGRNDQDRAERRGQETHRERFVDRVAEVARLLHSVEAPHQVSVLEISPAGGGVPGYLRVTCRDGTIVTQHPVGVLDGTPDADDVQAFAAQVHRGYAAFDPMLVSTLVYGGDPAAPALVDAALRQSVRLVSFVQYQGLIDLRSYVADQTERLRRDPIYPPSLYLTQRFQHLDRTLVAGATLDGEDARAQLLDWMAADEGGLVLVLGDFGRGKTFLLHELARALPEHLPHVVPMLVELRHLEKTHGLDELLAAHLAGAGVPRFDRDALRYMLRNGRIVLLFDGFDELALRVTYERAAEHLTTLLDALQGRAKMVLTSRSQHFRSDHQVRTALAARLDTANRRGLIELDDFTDEQIEAFLTRFYEGDTARAADRLALIRDIHDLLGLSRNPRMLGFIARLDESRLREVQAATGTISSADLYRELIAAWLDYESARARPSGAAPALTTEDRLAAVTALAVKLWQSTERTVSTRELAATAGTVLTTLDAHGLDSDHAAHQVGSGTLLVRTGDDAFTFVHASVMEYLVATACTPHLRTAGVTVEPLTQRPVSTLMADFVAGLAGWPATLRWARSILADDDATAAARRNALALARRHHADLTRRHGKAHAHAHRLTLTRGAHLAGADLTGADLSGLDLTDADLTNADLTGATLTSTTLRGAHLASATLHRAALIDADLTGANLTDADCTSARFERCTVTAATIDGGDWFQAALLGCTTDPRLASNPELRQAALTGRDRPRQAATGRDRPRQAATGR